jgi:hypothetical protein
MMKKFFLSLGLLVVCLIGGALRKEIDSLSLTSPVKTKCVGFTVLEAGKGVDCDGDTIRLEKRNGFYTAENK